MFAAPTGVNTIHAGKNNDTIIINADNNAIHTNDGTNTIYAGDGDDGDDTVTVKGGTRAIAAPNILWTQKR